jgi:hypothetical protein
VTRYVRIYCPKTRTHNISSMNYIGLLIKYVNVMYEKIHDDHYPSTEGDELSNEYCERIRRYRVKNIPVPVKRE